MATQETFPILPSISTAVLLQRFDPDVYTLTPDTMLYKFVDAICGTSGAGAIANQLMLTRMGTNLETIYFSELDFIFGNIGILGRSPAESYSYSPLTDQLTADQWNEVKIKDSWYRQRIAAFFQACNLGGTPEGIRMCVYAALGCDCNVYEVWRYIDCADEQTEILTRSGYKSYTELVVGEDALTINVDSGLAEWQPVLAINAFPVVDAPMLSVEMGGRHSSLTTMNHRWPVKSRQNKSAGRGYVDITIRRSHELSTEDKFVRAVPVMNLPDSSKYQDSLVELAGWFVTEGHINTVQGRDHTGVNICQSHKVNPEKVDQIRSALTELFGSSVEEFTTTKGRRNDRIPQWRESISPSKPDLTLFRLNSVAGSILCEVAPDKIATMEFINSLTKSQLHLFLETCIAGDGHVRGDGYRSIVQNSLERLMPIQVAATLLGIPTSVHAPQKLSSARPTYVLSFSEKSRFVTPLGQARKNASTVRYTGTVWCPRTGNGTWFARRRGTTYFTGNSFGLNEDLGRSPVATRNEIVIQPHKTSLSQEEIRLARDMIDRLCPADVIVTLNTSGLATISPVTVNAAAADSSYYEVQKVVTATPVIAQLPPAEFLPIPLRPSQTWLYDAASSPTQAPYAAFNVTQEYSYYYLTAEPTSIDSVTYGTLNEDGSVTTAPNYQLFQTTGSYGPATPYALADSPDNYPGGKYGLHPDQAPAINPDGSPYNFPWQSQEAYVTVRVIEIEAMGGIAGVETYQLPVATTSSTAQTFYPQYAISYFPPSKESTISIAVTGQRNPTQVTVNVRNPSNFVRSS